MRRFVSTRLALVVAWLCAVSPVLVSYAIYARSYALLVLVSRCRCGRSARCSSGRRGSVSRSGDSRRRSACGRTTSRPSCWRPRSACCSCACHGSGGACSSASPASPPRPRPLWSVFLAQNDASERTAYIATESLSGRLEGVVRQFAMGTNVPSAWLEGAGIAIVAAAGLYALVRARREPAARVLGALALLGAGLPILSALSGVDDKLLARNLLGVWIAVAPFAAYGLTRLRSAPLLVYSVICIATVIAVESDWRYQGQTDWGGASARIQAQARGEPVAVEPGLELAVASLYMHRTQLASAVQRVTCG
jgi:hypothetical protein